MKILAVGAHYDDLELSCGGTLAKFRKEKHQVFCIVVSSSNYSSYKGKVLRTKKQSEDEGYSGLTTLHIPLTSIINLNFPTKQVPFNNIIIEKINKWIDSIQPDLILTHGLNDSHQDHINTSRSVMSAARYCKNIWMFETLYPSKLNTIVFKPVIYVDISDTLEIKLQAIKAHKSQWKKYPYWNDLIISLARLRGIENKCQYAEAFEPIKQEYKI